MFDIQSHPQPSYNTANVEAAHASTETAGCRSGRSLTSTLPRDRATSVRLHRQPETAITEVVATVPWIGLEPDAYTGYSQAPSGRTISCFPGRMQELPYFLIADSAHLISAPFLRPRLPGLPITQVPHSCCIQTAAQC